MTQILRPQLSNKPLATILDKNLGLKTERRANFRVDCSLEVTTKIDGIERDTVRLNDLSTGGASIIVSPDTIIPNEFAIEGLVDDEPIQCQIAWKRDRLVGVRFVFRNYIPKTKIDLAGLLIT